MGGVAGWKYCPCTPWYPPLISARCLNGPPWAPARQVPQPSGSAACPLVAVATGAVGPVSEWFKPAAQAVLCSSCLWQIALARALINLAGRRRRQLSGHTFCRTRPRSRAGSLSHACPEPWPPNFALYWGGIIVAAGVCNQSCRSGVVVHVHTSHRQKHTCMQSMICCVVIISYRLQWPCRMFVSKFLTGAGWCLESLHAHHQQSSSMSLQMLAEWTFRCVIGCHCLYQLLGLRLLAFIPTSKLPQAVACIISAVYPCC